MKKNTLIKAMLSVATTSALVLGCAPLAFGAPSAGVSGTGNFNSNSAATEVAVATNAEQLSAEVPLNMTVVANAKGGALTGVPTTGYKITNKSYFKIKVEKIVGSKVGSWTYSDAALTASSAAGLSINFVLTPATGTATTVTNAGANTSSDAKWNIAAATSAAGTDLAIGVAGSTAPLTKSIGDTGEAAAKITYTIAAA